ncbi:MAG: hypothetical protein ACXWEW_09990 [Nitrososphaeraceae archaeon]
MTNPIIAKNSRRLNPLYMVALSMVATLLAFIPSLSQLSYAEDYKLNININNQENADIKTDVSIKTDEGKEKTEIKLNDNTEKIKETITGEPGEKVKVCLEVSDDKKKYCQTKKLPQDEDSIVKFKLEYET